MKVSDLIHGRRSSVALVRGTGESFPEGIAPLGEAVLHRPPDADAWLLRIGEGAWEVQGATGADTDTLRGLQGGASQRLCWIAQRTPERGAPERLTLQVHEFAATHDWSEPIRIGIDDRLVEDMRRQRGQLNSVESLVKWFGERLILHPRSLGGPVRALLAGTPSPAGDRQVAFRLYGAGWAADVATGPDNRLRVNRVVSVKRAQTGDDVRPIYLASGDIGFCDITLAGEFRGTARAEIEARARQSDSYLRLWRDYNELESAGLYERARAFGWLKYGRCEQLADGAWRFHLDRDNPDEKTLRERIQTLTDSGDCELEAGAQIPAELQGSAETPEPRGRGDKPFLGKPRLEGQGGAIRIDLRPAREREDRIPPKSGWLFASLGGDKTRIDRRNKAWEAIRGCANPMPQLGLLIEGAPIPVRSRPRREPMTPAVREVLSNPTDRQRLALEIALNTPDIALIQGPPGTGKTRVIAALQARLADKDEVAGGSGLAGNTLLTSFQHDAVENAAAATRVLGLPAIKIGYRKGTEEGGAWLDVWSRETAERVRAGRAERNEQRSPARALAQIRRLSVRYIEAPAPRDESAALLAQVRDLGRDWLPGEILDRIETLRARIAAPETAATLGDEDRADALKALRGLRVEPVPFADDGPAAAYRALRRLERIAGLALETDARALLEQAADLDPDAEPPAELLAGLASLRDRLIDRIRAEADRPPLRPIHADVADLCGEVVDALAARVRTSADGADLAVAEWLEALEQDPEGIRDTVAHYSMVYAATCQQAVGKAMSEAKAGDENAVVFRTVVVDEAARANPLDLLIPMARAERRIVLVGDHRQLPQVLEPEVERQLRGSLDAQMQGALERSLFERLFRELKEREARDGIKRTVTLDTQYRMHPTLGAFVSARFYAPHGEPLSSGREAVEFAHRVALFDGTALAGRVAAWIDIPHAAGAEARGRSKRRSVEAQRAAREAETILKANPELSVGVITFYAAQRDAILESLAGYGLTEPDAEEGYRIRDAWASMPDGRERLRVGTVDAFQGKEFDVVLLSLTRSNRIRVTDEPSRRARYGFLLLENRLCVAMSRQRSLLILLGDLAMARGEEAEQSVPALAAFAQLCEEGAHGRIVRT
jgi:hypothetical protein